MSISRKQLLHRMVLSGAVFSLPNIVQASTTTKRFVRRFTNEKEVEEYLNGEAAHHKIVAITTSGGDYRSRIFVVTEESE